MYYQICRKTCALFILLSVFSFVFETRQSAQIVNTQLQSLPETNEKLALTNVTLIDGAGGHPKLNQTLIISKGRISSRTAAAATDYSKKLDAGI